MPNGILRSALFGAIAKGKRRYIDGEKLAALDGIEISYTGQRLDQGDLDVWESVLHVMRNQPITAYCFRHQFAADLKANGDDEATCRGLGHISAETRRLYGTAGQASKGHRLRPLQIDAERPVKPRPSGPRTKRRGEPKP